MATRRRRRRREILRKSKDVLLTSGIAQNKTKKLFFRQEINWANLIMNPKNKIIKKHMQNRQKTGQKNSINKKTGKISEICENNEKL